MDHFLNDCEIRFWMIPSKEHDKVPAVYINHANYFTAVNELVAMGILDYASYTQEAQAAIQRVYQEDGRQVFATHISEIGEAMFNPEQMANKTVN